MSLILSEGQRYILDLLPAGLKERFVFGGGTALAEHYLSHRRSEDLDFFALNRKQPVRLVEIEGILKNAGFEIDSVNKLFDRCIYGIRIHDELIKTEFVPLYFPRLQAPTECLEFNLKVESLQDLAANKIMAMSERFEIKDFVDIYAISRHAGWPFLDMIKFAEAKEALPYRYTVHISRIFAYREELNQIRYIEPFDVDQILEFYKLSDKELKFGSTGDFE